MGEIVIVTAFFDIGREHFQNTPYARSSQVYMKQFEFWARMQNELIVFTQPEFVASIKEIRDNFGLAEKTKIIEVEDIFSVEKNLYDQMKRVEKNPQYALWRVNPNALSNRADYDYVTLMKFWCLKEAAKEVRDDTVLAWMDFGFNHAGDLYICEDEFAFTWKYQDFFDDRRIRIFTLFDPDDVLLGESLQIMYVCVMGCMVIVPQELSGKLWELTKNAMRALVMLEAIDDDQQLLVMAYKYMPQIFKVQQSSWFHMLKDCGGVKLSCREKQDNEENAGRSGKLSLRACLHNILGRCRNTKKTSNGLDKELADRIFQAAQKYYQYR